MFHSELLLHPFVLLLKLLHSDLSSPALQTELLFQFRP